MKLTKKILSIVLAACLLLGTIAVAANAAGLTEYAGSKLTYRIEADKTEVKPGETVKFSVYMTTNYYTGSSGGEFFLWTSSVFESMQYEVKNFAATFSMTPNTAPAAAMYPSTHSASNYGGVLFSRSLNAGVTAPTVVEDELVYEITLKVKDDAAPGTTAVFEMPAGSVKSPSLNTRKGVIYQVLSTSSSAIADYAYSYCESVDLSAASVTIKVASAAVLGEITDVQGSETYVNDTAVVAVNVTGAPEKLTVTAPDGTYEYTRDDADITATATGEEWVIEVPVYEEGENVCTVTADYGEAGVTPATAFTVTGIGYCDYDALEAAVAKTPEMAEEYYDAEAYKAWADAKAAGQALLDAEKLYNKDGNQDKIDAAAQLIETTFAALEARFVDTTPITTAIEESVLEYADEYYDAAKLAAFRQAVMYANQIVTSYKTAADTQQNRDVIASYVNNVREAYAALEPLFVDASAIAEAITAYGTTEYAAEYYDAAEYAAWEAALAAANDADFAGKADTEANRAAVAKIADDLKVAYEALDARFVSLDELHNAIIDYHDPMMEPEWFDANEYAAWEAALDAANEGLTTYEGKADTEENRAAVAKLAEDLIAAYRELDPRSVDVSDLEAALAESVPAYGAEYYDAAAYADFTAAVVAGEAIVDEMGGGAAPDTEENRTTVAEAAQAIRDAYAALVPQFVSYEKLEKAVADYGTAPETEFYYTPDSWAAYEDALAAANDANNNRPQPLPAANDNNQAAVDAYADALEKAYNELTAAVCHVISVTPLQENYVVNNWINFAVLVEGTPAKIQLVKESGVTSTYSPDTPQVVSITDNGDGTQTWVINRRVFEEEYTEYAKAKMGRNWDTGVVPYDVKCTVEDAEVKSVEVTLDGEVVDTALRTDFPTVTIVTGPATKKVRLLDPVTGGSLTYAEPTSVNEDGTKVWVIVKQYYQVKQYDLDILFLGSTGKYIDSGLDLEINIVEERESQLPSTDKVEDAIYSAEVAKTRILKGSTQTFTYTTDKDCKAVRILNADGSVFRTIKTSTSVADGVATWVYECAYNSLGERSYTAEALYGETWIADVDSAVSFNIAY